MHYRYSYLFFVAVPVALILLNSYSAGAGASGVKASGAPGDGINTCTSCHGGGSFNPVTVDFEVLDGGGSAVTELSYGVTYTVNIAVNAGSGTPSGYGFQMAAVSQDNDILNYWSSPSANAQLSMVSGRQYVEHDGTSASQIFTADFKVPSDEFLDSMRFYIGANVVNGNGQTTGDNALMTSFPIDMAPPPTGLTSIAARQQTFYPNPADGAVNYPAGLSKFEVFDRSGRRVVFESASATAIDVSEWPNGLYYFITGEKVHQVMVLH